MLKIKNKLIKFLSKNPKFLFLIDGSGAMLSASFLFVIARHFDKEFGISEKTLIYLSAIPSIFFVYSITCFLTLKNNWPPFIKLVIFFNLIYCFLTALLLSAYFPVATPTAKCYFILETMVVLFVVYLEFKTLLKINTNLNTIRSTMLRR